MEQNINQLPAEITPQGRSLATPARPAVRSDLQMYKKQPEIINRAIRPIDLLYAIRRRWALALVLGFVATTLTILYAQLTIPVEYNAKVMMRFAEAPDYILFKKPTERNWLNDRGAQASLIRSTIVLVPALQQSGISKLSCLKNQQDKVHWLSTHLNVGYTGSEILTISINGPDKDELVKILTAVRDAYMQEIVQVERDLDTQKRATVDRAYKNLEKAIQRKEIQYQNLADRLGVSDSKNAMYSNRYAQENLAYWRQKRDTNLARINGLAVEIKRRTAFLEAMSPQQKGASQAEREEARVKQRTEMIRALTIEALNKNPELVELRKKYEQIQMLLERERSVAKDQNHPNIKRLEQALEESKNEIDTATKRLTPEIAKMVQSQIDNQEVPLSKSEQLAEQIEQLKIDLAVFQAEYESCEKSYQAELAKAKTSGETSELESLRAELTRMKTMYDRMGSQLAEWNIEAQAGPRVQTISEPEAPKHNNQIEKFKTMGLMGLMSFIGTFIVVSGLDFLGRRVNTSDELSYGLGLHVMGDLPLISKGVRHNRVNQSIQGLLMESIDNIRTALLHHAEAENMKALLITSSLEKEGKTTVSSQLAASLARTGRKVVLVDVDLRRPSAHRMFDRPLNPGLAEFLRKKVALDEVITTTRVENLWIIPAGTPHPDAIIALAQGGMEEPMQLLREQFDFVLVDSGPVLTDADVLVMGRLCDGVLLSVLRDVSRIPLVYEACERIRSVDIPLIGTVLNGVSFGKYRPYYSSYTIEVSTKSKSKARKK
ncbi:MAG: polysaccharide biosynthesis tyrosine autokinase [Thermoguttaceae bacterium]|nr:polysaccharide biosynthesis tyrosine autokinase [Thermoguttaceae bacterium]